MTEAAKPLDVLRASIKINGDGTATLPADKLSWALNELELWPQRAAHAEAAPAPTPREIANELSKFERQALTNYYHQAGSVELALELRVAINRILGYIPFEASGHDEPAPGLRELIAECDRVVNSLSPNPSENTDREYGRAEAYASIGRQLREAIKWK